MVWFLHLITLHIRGTFGANIWTLRAELSAEFSVFVNANDRRILFDAASEHQRVQSVNIVENEPIRFLTCQNNFI